MIYLCEQLFLHDKVLSFLHKFGNLLRNEGFAWWFRLRHLIIIATARYLATVKIASLQVCSSSFQNSMNDRLIGCITIK